MSFGELLFLTLLALLVFGPRKLPEMARTLARITAELRRASNEFRYTLEDEIRNIDNDLKEATRIEAKPAAGTIPVAGSSSTAEPPAPAEAGSHLRELPAASAEDTEIGEYGYEFGDEYGEEDWIEEELPLEDAAAGKAVAAPGGAEAHGEAKAPAPTNVAEAKDQHPGETAHD